MSYIRSASNPEGLYVFGSANGIEMYTGKANKDIRGWVIPVRHFNEVCKRWNVAWEERVKYGDFSCEMVWVDSEFEEKEEKEVGEEIEKFFKRAVEGKLNKGLSLENKVKLTWKDESMYLWDVTWQFVVQRIIDELS